MIVLGIESSCDETGVAIYDSALGLRAHAVHSQVDLHARYGGVVPELASRDHVQRVVPLVREVMNTAGVQSTDLSAIAYTRGPGLVARCSSAVGSLHRSVRLGYTGYSRPSHGRSFAGTDVEQDLQLSLSSPCSCPEDHPAVAVTGVGRYKILGQSLDDAVGEAFDKTASAGLPAGWSTARGRHRWRPDALPIPRPMTDRPGLDFSFSGLGFRAPAVHAETDLEVSKADIARCSKRRWSIR